MILRFLKLASLAQCFKTTFMRLLGWFSNTLSKVAFIRKSFITLFIWIMKSASSAGVLTTKPEQNIGLAEIHGALIGASLDFSALKCTRTTSASRRHVCGLCQGQARLFSPGFFSFILINKPLFSLSFLLSSTANNCFHLLAEWGQLSKVCA